MLLRELHDRDINAPAHGLSARPYPQVIKYMGSKAGIIDFVVAGINRADNGGSICDLFAGACSLSGAIGNQVNILTNDIQEYSKVIASVYLCRLSGAAAALTGRDITTRAASHVGKLMAGIPEKLHYPRHTSLREFNRIEESNRTLIGREFKHTHHLFIKNYSGTWWSALQCAWIDALRAVADEYRDQGILTASDHSIFLTVVMHAMAYCGQGTGHYAQYRDAGTESSMNDINIYRQKLVSEVFEKKFDSLKIWNLENVRSAASHQFWAMDFRDCLSRLKSAVVYADPPYAFVHYSRFYHAIETFVRYDYPALQTKGEGLVKGRYREDRHQSPFSIRSLVPKAFRDMFEGVSGTGSNLVLSYSNTALLDLPSMIQLARETFGRTYSIDVLTRDHMHMTMGRRADRGRNVEEAILVAKRIGIYAA